MASDLEICEALLAGGTPTEMLRRILELSEPARDRLHQIYIDVREANGFASELAALGLLRDELRDGG